MPFVVRLSNHERHYDTVSQGEETNGSNRSKLTVISWAHSLKILECVTVTRSGHR